MRVRRILVALAMVAFVIEIGVRVMEGTLFDWSSPLAEREANSVLDPVVGYLPRAGVSVTTGNGIRFTIGAHGTRQHDGPPVADRPLVVAVGDSFTFGDDVTDADSWPAILERIRGVRVINGGVPGFGLDQSVLQAERLNTLYRPDTVLVSFIPDDVHRCSLAAFSGRVKPYFDVEGGSLRFHPTVASSPGIARRILDRSRAAHRVVGNWIGGYQPEVAHQRGPEVACLLMQRLADLSRPPGPRVVLVAQPEDPGLAPEHVEIATAVVECARRQGLSTLNLFPVFAALSAEERAKLWSRHLTPEGNALVARALHEYLDRGESAAMIEDE